VTVAVVGLGAIGTPAAWLLAQRGHRLALVDDDRVAPSNLPRQVLYTEADVGRAKATVLAERLGHAAVGIEGRLTTESADGVLAGVDLVVDGSDNWPTRQTLDAWCRPHGIAWLFLSALRWEGQALVMRPDGPCLRCLFGEGQDGPACFDVGIVGPVAGWVAAAGIDAWERGAGELILVDGWSFSVRRVRLPSRECPHGGRRRVG